MLRSILRFALQNALPVSEGPLPAPRSYPNVSDGSENEPGFEKAFEKDESMQADAGPAMLTQWPSPYFSNRWFGGLRGNNFFLANGGSELRRALRCFMPARTVRAVGDRPLFSATNLRWRSRARRPPPTSAGCTCCVPFVSQSGSQSDISSTFMSLLVSSPAPLTSISL
jgi:hypothetical protein